MSESEPRQSNAGGDMDADGFRVEERAETEEYHQTKEVREEGDRTEIHLIDGKVVKLEEVKAKETVRLASPEEVRALIEAEFEGLEEIGAGKEITVEEFNRNESRYERTVDGQPIVEMSLTEEHKSKEIKEDPQWKKDSLQFPDHEMETSATFGLTTDPVSVDENVAVSADAALEAPTVAVKTAEVSVTPPIDSSLSMNADASMDQPAAAIDVSVQKPKGLGNIFGHKKPSKEKVKSSVEAMEVDDTEKENEAMDANSLRRHEVKHKRHIIEEVVIEDTDKFYEKQEKRPKIFLKGTTGRKKESPSETATEVSSEGLKPPQQSLHAGSLPNVTSESVTYTVNYDPKTSGSMTLKGPDDKPHAEHKWYSFPRKHVTAKPLEGEAKIQLKPKAKGQEEVVVFDSEIPESPENKRDFKVGKWTEGAASPEVKPMEQLTFVVENEPVVKTPKKDLHSGSPETHTFTVEQGTPKHEVEIDREKHHSWGLFGKSGKFSPEKEASLPVVEQQTVTYVVETQVPEAHLDTNKDRDISLNILGKDRSTISDDGSSKPSTKTEKVTIAVEQPVLKADVKLDKPKEHSEEMTFVVEHDVPKTEVKLDKEKEHSWSLLGKIGGLFPEKEKDSAKEKPELETVTFVVEQDIPKAEVNLDKDKEHSGSFLGKIGAILPEKDTSTTDHSKVKLHLGARPKQQEVIVDQPQYYSEKNPSPRKADVELKSKAVVPTEESMTFTVQTTASTPSEEGGDKKSWSLKWPTAEKKEKNPSARKADVEVKSKAVVPTEESMTFTVQTTASTPSEEGGDKKSWSLKWPTAEKKEKKRRFQDEVVIDDTHLQMDERGIKLKPAVKGSANVEAEPKVSVNESITFVVKEETPVKAEAHVPSLKISPKDKLVGDESVTFVVEGQVPAKAEPRLQAETKTFVVEQDIPKTEVKLDKEKEHSWSLLGKIGGLFPEKDTSKATAETETVTYVVEQPIPKTEVKLDKGKEHSWSLLGKAGAEKDTSKVAAEPETVTFVVEQDTPKAEVKLGIEKEHPTLPKKDIKKPVLESETITFVVEQGQPEPKETKLNLLGKIGGLFPEKTSSKTSVDTETMEYVVDVQPPAVEADVSTGKIKPPSEKVAVTSERKPRWHQEELIVDDNHLFSDDSELKLNIKAPHFKRKKEYVVTSEPVSTKESPKVVLDRPTIENEGGADHGTIETVTFIVKEELPPENISDGKANGKTSKKPWKIRGFGRPTIGLSGKDDQGNEVEKEETVTYVVQEEQIKAEKKPEVKAHIEKKPEIKAYIEKKPEIKANIEKTVAIQKPRIKDRVQEEVIVDDTHLHTEKSPTHRISFPKATAKNETEVQLSTSVEHPKNKKVAAQDSGIIQETVTYEVTTEVINADLDSSAVKIKDKPHKWKVFGKKSSRGSEKSGSTGSLPSSASKDTTLIRHRQEEVVVGGDQTHVVENQRISASLGTGKEKVDLETKVETAPAIAVKIPDIQNSRAVITGEVAEPEVSFPEASQLKFELGDAKSIENKQEFIETPEPKKIVLGMDPLKVTLNYDEDGKQPGFMVNGYSGETERTELITRSADTSKFETSTPKKEFAISTGAHGDGAKGSDTESPLDVTASSSTSMTLSQPVGRSRDFDASFEGSSGTGSRPSSYYVGQGVSGNVPLPSPHFVVIAIDFGTTFSGYAFSFTRDIDSIHVMRKWPDGDPGVVNQKTPTVLLLTPEGKFHSFGFTAKDFYHNLTPTEAKKWLYFEKFKMALHYNAELSTTTEIEAANGQSFPALTVFSHALRFFRDYALREVSDQSQTRILNEDVCWVITVPAIWKAPAKQFMRQAAYQAGIASQDNPGQLLVALEPEAASIFIRKQRLQQLIPESVINERSISPVSIETTSEPVLLERISQVYDKQDTNRWSQSLQADATTISFQRAPSPLYTPVRVGDDLDLTGMRYMVADCGGGTVDITVYELHAETGKLLELYKATGGPYGSVGVDLEFEKLLVDIFGAEFIEVFKAKRPGGWVDLLMAFESRKRAATPIKSKPLNVSLPFSFTDYHKKHKNSTVESAVRKYGNKDVKWSAQGMLRLMPDAMTRLFQPTLDNIKEAIANVLNKPEVKGIKYIFLVGGFAESPMLQVEMRHAFSDVAKILIPADAHLAILKGAVCFGCDPGVVTVRKSRMSYGLAVLNRFVHGKHPESKLGYKDGVEWCVDVFDPLVLANQSVTLGTSVIHSYTTAGSGQKFGNIDIYSSESSEVQFITDPGVKNCGKLRLDLSNLDQSANGGRRREVQCRMTFGDTEIKVVALDVATGNTVRAAIDFLNK